MAAIFPATYFTFSTRYPESGTSIQLGNSYQFDVLHPAPDQRLFILTLQGMAYFTEADGSISLTQHTGRNIAVLEQFYNEHRRAIPFTLKHPVYGNVTVKFNRPLEIPKGIPGGTGVTENIEVELKEIP